ncbi:MAG: nucleotide sugar dehydrogenase [Acidimicrobiia bacterium]
MTPHPPTRKVGVVGLGYVGLPVAVAFADEFEGTVGFDVNQRRVDELQAAHDRTREVSTEALEASTLTVTSDIKDLEGVDFFLVTVPTPIDADKRPDLSALESASRSVGSVIRPGAVVVFESTVYPGATENVCGPIIEATSGLKAGEDFALAYSPERINPGDAAHRFQDIPKVVSGQDDETLRLVADMYRAVVRAEIHEAPSIAVAEAAKVIENTQRDLNIALINELAIIFDRLDIDTEAVLDAASTKWNFSRFTPGLVGGHCIGVDPYYLTARAQEVGVEPRVILAGRDVNTSMGQFVADSAIEKLADVGIDAPDATILVAGVTFKENVPDVRNSGVVSVVHHLRDTGASVTVWDPVCDSDALEPVGITVNGPGDPATYDAIILAVPHTEVVEAVGSWVVEHEPRVLIDIKGAIDQDAIPPSVVSWRL